MVNDQERLKAEKARAFVAWLRRRGEEILVWNEDFYTDSQIIQELERAGYRYSERESSWHIKQEAMLKD